MLKNVISSEAGTADEDIGGEVMGGAGQQATATKAVAGLNAQAQSSSDNYSIVYSERNILGVAVHGVIEIVDNNNNVVRSVEGLAYNGDPNGSSIGAEFLGYMLEGFSYNGASQNALSTPVIVFSGTEQQVDARLEAMDAATQYAWDHQRTRDCSR